MNINKTKNKNIFILAQQIINESIGVIEGCRKIVSSKTEQEIRDDDDFLTITAIESETDEFPIGETRSHYHKKNLEKLDKELDEYLKVIKPIIFEACRNLINKCKYKIFYLTEAEWRLIPEDNLSLDLGGGKFLDLNGSLFREDNKFILILDTAEQKKLYDVLVNLLIFITSRDGSGQNNTGLQIKQLINIFDPCK